MGRTFHVPQKKRAKHVPDGKIAKIYYEIKGKKIRQRAITDNKGMKPISQSGKSFPKRG
jgi:hypothetical protein